MIVRYAAALVLLGAWTLLVVLLIGPLAWLADRVGDGIEALDVPQFIVNREVDR